MLCIWAMGISGSSRLSAFSSTNWQIKVTSAFENVIIARSADLLMAATTFCTLKSSLVPSFFTTLISLQFIFLPLPSCHFFFTAAEYYI